MTGRGRGRSKPPQVPGRGPTVPGDLSTQDRSIATESRPLTTVADRLSQMTISTPSRQAPEVYGAQAPLPSPLVASSGSGSSPSAPSGAQEFYLEKASHVPKRPSTGDKGKRIRLVSNFFSLSFAPITVYHYDVEILTKEASGLAPEERQRALMSCSINRRVMQELLTAHKNDFNGNLPAFDGKKNMYCKRALNFRQKAFRVSLEGGERQSEFVIKIQYAADVNLAELQNLFEGKCSYVSQSAIQALDIIFREGPAQLRVPVGRSFFSNDGYSDPYAITGGRELWFGYYCSVRPTMWKAALNMDSSSTTFHQAGPLHRVILSIIGDRNLRQLTDRQLVKVNKELKGLKIEVTHLQYSRKYRIAKITKEPAMRITFKLDNGTETTVADYFRNRYRRLEFPNLPCVQAGTAAKPTYIPVEVCNVLEKQHCRIKPDDVQTAEIIRKAAVTPRQRFNQIESSLRSCLQDSGPYLREFEIKVNSDPIQVDARVLPAPQIMFKNSSTEPRDGVWMVKDRFCDAQPISKWVILHCANLNVCSKEDLERFTPKLISVAKSLGIAIEKPLNILRFDPNNSIKDYVDTIVKTRYKDIQLLLAVISKKATTYCELKAISETKLGLMTQCLTDEVVARKCNPNVLTNILLKINAKMGGINSKLRPDVWPTVFKKPIIIFGGDVSHPSPGVKDVSPSIAALVASVNASASRYCATVRVQKQDSVWKSDLEVMSNLKDMIKEQLKVFYRATRQKPERIIFYRDGVSEGQFLAVRNYEVAAIRKACIELSGSEKYEPGLTFITVQKRHHTRFMPRHDADGVGKCKNVPPGTTVDTGITHPLDFDFYLCSHFGIQGTSRPCHYYVLWDDNNFTADELQTLSYYLCHTYVRCARSVSVPAPVYYAHLAAVRAKEHINSRLNTAPLESESLSDPDTLLTTSILDETVLVTEAIKPTMYFV